MTAWFRYSVFVISVLLATVNPASAQLGTVPYTFSPGGTISSNQFNTMFSAIYSNALNRTGGTMTGTLITTTVRPTADNTSDLGSASYSYRNGWFDGTLTVATLSGSISATSRLTATVTTEQIRAAYDGSNYLSITVASTGATTFDATGSGAAFTFSDMAAFTVGLKERSRTVAMGDWAAHAYSAGDFTTSNVSHAWTVDSGDVTTNRYMLVGKTVTWQFVLASTDLGGDAAHLRIAVPGSLTEASLTRMGACRAVDGGVSLTPFLGYWLMDGSGYAKLFRGDAANWTTTSGDNMAVACTIVFEIA